MYDLVGPVGLWIAGGRNLDGSTAKVEFIAVNSSSQLAPDLPKTIASYPSMFLHNETIVLCGGYHNEKSCLKLQEGTWTKYNSLKKERSFAAVVSTTKATFIFGGWGNADSFEYLEKNTSEWKLGETKVPGLGFQHGCAIAISQDEIWLIGGYDTEQRILSFNVNNQSFTELPTTLKQGREELHCAFIPGTRNIMVTGGKYYGNRYDSTEIINVEIGKVIEGPPMNSKRASHGIGVLNVDSQERLVVIGGEKGYVRLESVEVYNSQTQKWELTNIELSEAKTQFGFLTIKSQP